MRCGDVCQVAVLLAGEVTMGPQATFQCPSGSQFSDSYGGLYGPTGAYVTPSAQCKAGGGSGVLASTLQFQCSPCGPGAYAMAGGSSNGTAGQRAAFQCLPCPLGGVCSGVCHAPTTTRTMYAISRATAHAVLRVALVVVVVVDGARLSWPGTGIVPSPGFWGAVDASNDTHVTFQLCPSDYCCDGSVEWPCVALGTCKGCVLLFPVPSGDTQQASPSMACVCTEDAALVRVQCWRGCRQHAHVLAHLCVFAPHDSNRRGALCGSCNQGYTTSLGSSQCVAEHQCARDKPLVWTLLVAAVFVAAVLQVVVNSDLWCTSRTHPSGKMKLVIYYAQVLAVGVGVLPHSV
jgi:hypothetical protein